MALLKRKRTGLTDAMSVVTKFVNACNRHDAETVAACLHPDFDSIQPMYPSRNFRGADQVRRNWQAIFDAEPGFRLTVLRSAAIDDTVWLELHGAGRDAEVAGVFVMGIQGDRIRWARIYSALVEPVPAGVGEAPAPAAGLHEVPPLDEPSVASNGEVVEEAIAPVLDIERSGRRRRRRRGADNQDVAASPVAEAEAEVAEEAAAPAAEVAEVDEEPAAADVAEVAEVADEPDAAEEVEVVEALPDDVVVEAVEPEPDLTVVVVADEPVPGPEVVVVAVVDEEGGPPTEAVEMATLTEPEPEAPVPEGPEVAAAPSPEPPKRRFGKRSRS